MEASRSSILKNTPTECQLGGDHQGQFLTTVCAEAGCNWKLCCAVCLHENHQNHKTQPLKMFLKQVAANTQMVPRDSDKTMVDDTIAQSRKVLKQTVAQQRKALTEMIDNMEREMLSQLSFMEKQLNFMSINADQLSMQLLNVKSQAQLQQLIDSIVESGLNNQKPPESRYLLKELTSKQSVILREFSEYTDQLEFRLEQLVSRATQLHKIEAKKTLLRFSQCHKDFQIATAKRVMLGGKTSCYKLALMDPALEVDSVTRVKFALSNSSIGVGVCLANKIKSQGYTIGNYSIPGHGFWGIYGSRLVYSHSNAQYNYKQLAFELDNKQPIEMVVDRTSNLLIFLQGTNSYSMPIAPDNRDILKVALILVQSGTHAEYMDQ